MISENEGALLDALTQVNDLKDALETAKDEPEQWIGAYEADAEEHGQAKVEIKKLWGDFLM